MIYMATIVLCLSADSFDERTHLVVNSQANTSAIGVNEMVTKCSHSLRIVGDRLKLDRG